MIRRSLGTALLIAALAALVASPATHAGDRPSRETKVTIDRSQTGNFQGRLQTVRRCKPRRKILLYADRDGGPDGFFDSTETDAEGRYRFEPTLLEPGVRYYTVANVDRRRGILCEKGRSKRYSSER